MQGRKPVPTVIKEARGTNRADRGVKNEAAFPVPGRMPSPPKGLTDDGEALWRSLGKILLDAGLFSAGDALALEMLCVSYERYKIANRSIGANLTNPSKKNPDVYIQNPLLSISNKAWEQIYKLLAQFGLTPAERTRVLAAVQNDQEDDLATVLFRQASGE
jgi:P27 family predicted phage terminase small subunit